MKSNVTISILVGFILVVTLFGIVQKVSANDHCSDFDRDCISDEAEFLFTEYYMPVFEYDEDEHNIVTDQPEGEFNQWNGVIFLHQVSPVNCYLWSNANGGHTIYYDPLEWWNDNGLPGKVLLTVVATYQYDYVPIDPSFLVDPLSFAGEQDRLSHYGDTEVVRICLADDNGDGNYEVDFVHTVRHHHDYVYLPHELEWEGSHPYMYVSEGKHATYASKDECEGSVSWYEDFAWREDCGEGPIVRPYPGLEQFPGNYLNVGEYDRGKNLSLDDMGIADYFGGWHYEAVWTKYENDESRRAFRFCGGYNVNDANGTNWNAGYPSKNCSGGLDSKWWKRPQY